MKNWSNFQPLVDAETMEHEDRISELPCDILIHILSFLTLEQSARTSTLSKSWINVWSMVPRLNFDAEKMLIKEEDILPEPLKYPYPRNRFVDLPGLKEKFVDCVNSVLRSRHISEKIVEFQIRFELDEYKENDINNWLEFAFARKVQILELELLLDGHNYANPAEAYGFPNRIVDQTSNESSKESPPLPSNHGYVHNQYILRLWDFDSLRSLSLARVSVSGEVISFFLNKCRNLERVKVCKSENLFSLEVRGTFPALKYLEICHCSFLQNITVRDTNLVSLKLEKVSILENNPKLVEVCLAPNSISIEFLPLVISRSLSRVQILTLLASRFDATEVIGVPQLTEVKQLTLNVKQWKPESLMHLTSLIGLSRNLEKFVLQLERIDGICMEDRPWMKGPKLALPYLKTVEFRGYYGREAEDELIIFFVENATCLETLIIDPCGLNGYPEHRDLLSEKESIKRAHKLKELIPSSVKLTTKEATMQKYSAW